MRTVTLPKDFVDLRNVPMNIHDIETNIRDFYNALDFEMENDVKSQCLDARGFLDSARILVRNLISIEDNKYIEACKKAYFFMQGNLGRVDARITEVELENIDKLVVHEGYQEKRLPDSPMIRRYMNSLIVCMEHLVYYPLKNSLKKFNETTETEDGEKIKKDKDLYIYFLFLELLHSSESLGAVTSEKRTGKIASISPTQVSYESTAEYKSETDSPSALPGDVEIEVDELDEEVNDDDIIDEEKINERVKLEKKLFEDDDLEIVEEDEDESD